MFVNTKIVFVYNCVNTKFAWRYIVRTMLLAPMTMTKRTSKTLIYGHIKQFSTSPDVLNVERILQLTCYFQKRGIDDVSNQTISNKSNPVIMFSVYDTNIFRPLDLKFILFFSIGQTVLMGLIQTNAYFQKGPLGKCRA